MSASSRPAITSVGQRMSPRRARLSTRAMIAACCRLNAAAPMAIFIAPMVPVRSGSMRCSSVMSLGIIAASTASKSVSASAISRRRFSMDSAESARALVFSSASLSTRFGSCRMISSAT